MVTRWSALFSLFSLPRSQKTVFTIFRRRFNGRKGHNESGFCFHTTSDSHIGREEENERQKTSTVGEKNKIQYSKLLVEKCIFLLLQKTESRRNQGAYQSAEQTLKKHRVEYRENQVYNDAAVISMVHSSV